VAADATIRVEGLWKRYGLPLAADLRRARARLRSIWRGGEAPQQIDPAPWSLRDVSFEVRRGESLGVIGRNGAGKSTLLKILAGVTPATRGRVAVAGRIFPMIELNAGINRDLTGRENVELLGAVMGFGRREIAARMPAIEAFCELGDWFDRPARKYSSGMLARIGFGVAMNVEAEVVLVDEILAVGDFAFQKKCVQRMASLSSTGVTVLFVSHNPYLLERMCDRVVMLDAGRLEELGQPADVIHRYYESAEPALDPALRAPADPHERPGTGDLRIQSVEMLNARGDPPHEHEAGGALVMRLHYEAPEPVREPNFSLRVYDPQNTMVLSLAATRFRHGAVLEGKGYVDCRVAQLPLMPNLYTLQVKVSGDVLIDLVENAAAFRVRASSTVLVDSANMGIACAEPEWSFR